MYCTVCRVNLQPWTDCHVLGTTQWPQPDVGWLADLPGPGRFASETRCQDAAPCYTDSVNSSNRIRHAREAPGRTNAVDLTTVERIQAMVLGWYAKHGRRFVWRVPSPDPYVVLVSEIMLQQTQTARVQQRLPEFLSQFPDFAALAAADNATVIRAWRGMGYNNRALRLRDCARIVVQQFQGSLPDRRTDLEQLPGLGPYTVGAILSFAFHQDTVVLDVNIRRLYSRLFLPLATTADTMSEPLLHHVAEQTYPRGRSSEWHQACMDIAAEYCTAHAPKCLFCPAADACCSAFRLVESVTPRIAEPSHRGKPNRIWRGRIVEILRGLPPSEALDVPALAERLLGVTDEHDTPWLTSVLAALERDGIVESDPGSHAIRLRS